MFRVLICTCQSCHSFACHVHLHVQSYTQTAIAKKSNFKYQKKKKKREKEIFKNGAVQCATLSFTFW